MTLLMLGLWQTQGEQYKSSFDTCTQAYYQGSEIKHLVDNATDKFRHEYPIVAGTAPVVYAIGIRRQIKLSSKKVTLVPDTTTTYEYNHNTHSGSVGISWNF